MIYWIAALLFRPTSRWPPRPSSGVCGGLFLIFSFLLASFFLSSWDHESPGVSSFAHRSTQTLLPASAEDLSIVDGGLEEIKHAGKLRVLAHRPIVLAAQLVSVERNLIVQYALEQDLGIEWIELGEEQLRISYLQQDKGDIVLTVNATQEEYDQAHLSLTLPWGVSQQQVITRSDTGRIRDIEDLGTRQIAIKRSSPVWGRLQRLAPLNPSMDVIIIPEAEEIESILERVASAQYDVTIVDNLQAESLLPQFLNLEVAFNVTEPKTVSWAVSSDAKELLEALNSFLNKQYLQSAIARSYQNDLPELQAKKLLRLITYQSPVNYYLQRGKLKGFEHDLVKRFAANHRMRLDVVIADSHEEMLSLLASGKGDLAAGSLPRSSFKENEQLAFTQAYNHAAPTVIGRTGDTPLLDVKSLAGRRIVLPAASPYLNVLQRIKSEGIEFDLIMADAGESSEAILFRVASGIYDLTVIGGHELKAQFKRQINLRAHFPLTEPLPHVWAVREKDTQLLSALNKFIAREFRKGFYNVLYSKYIDKPRTLSGDAQLLTGIEKLSPYDDLVHKYATRYGFDWRLIVAQMYQESQFDPRAISYAGAEGLMQIIPATADLLGIDDTYDPATSIQAGIRYMDYLRSKFDEDQLLEDRTWFSLAAYNAGYGRVHRARLLAENMNLDKNKWFDNVEKAMLVLAKPYLKDGETRRNCRCGQTVVYVRDIRTLYSNYVRLTRSIKTVSNASELSKDI
jgi:membrane-bound lytic murein transglycosylase F